MELNKILQEFNYQIVYTEDMNFDQQAKLFSQTEHLISLHGAGLTNLMFMPSGSHVLEIRNQDISKQPLCYFELSNIFEIHWDYIMATASERKNNSDVTLEIDQLKRAIRDMHMKVSNT